MSKSHVPLVAIVISVCLFGVAGLYYPGGTTESANTVGYNWAHNFISSLFAPNALNGAPNPARLVAIPAMLILCVGLAALFWSISRKATSRVHKKAIEIGGVGSMVYASLVVTPMHDLMIDIALPFGLVALLAILHLLHTARRSLLFLLGTVSVTLLLLTAAMYYGRLLSAFLPVMQKMSLVACIGWLVAVYYRMVGEATEAIAIPHRSSPA